MTVLFAVFMMVGLNWTSVLLVRAENTQPSINSVVNAAVEAGLIESGSVSLMQYGELINLNIFCLAGTILCSMIIAIQLYYDLKKRSWTKK